MRYWSLGFSSACALLVLAACGKAADPVPSAPEGEAAAPAGRPGPEGATSGSDARALLGGLVSPRQKGAYAPRDDCAKLPGAAAFREALATAVAARDAAAVAALAQSDVRLGFGGDDGRERLVAKLGEDGGALMLELDALLRLGCAADEQGGITMPWFFAQDYGDLDSYSAMLVTGVDVPLHAAPDAASPVRQRMSWDLVTLDQGWFPDKPFQQATTLSGGKGYVATGKLRSMLDYRLLATRQYGTWKISAFVAGD